MKNLGFKLTISTLVLALGTSTVAQTTNVTRTVISQTNLVGDRDLSNKFLNQADSQKLRQETFKAENANKLRIEVERSALGGVHGGGGDSAADSKGQRRLLDLLEKDELEYFYPDQQLKESSRYLYMSDLWAGLYKVVDGMISYAVSNPHTKWPESMDLGDPQFLYFVIVSYSGQRDVNAYYQKEFSAKVYGNTWKELGLIPGTPLKWAFTDMELEDIADEGQIRYENEETKKQVAIQKDGLVVVSRPEFKRLDEDSRAALFLHESVLRSVLLLRPANILQNGTADVRAFTRRFYNYMKAPANSPAFPVREAYNKFGIVDPTNFWRLKK